MGDPSPTSLKFDDLKEMHNHSFHTYISAASNRLSLSQVLINECFHNESNSLSFRARHTARRVSHRDRQAAGTSDRRAQGGEMKAALVRAVVCLSVWLCVCQVRGLYIPQEMNRTLQNLRQHYVSTVY